MQAGIQSPNNSNFLFLSSFKISSFNIYIETKKLKYRLTEVNNKIMFSKVTE